MTSWLTCHRGIQTARKLAVLHLAQTTAKDHMNPKEAVVYEEVNRTAKLFRWWKLREIHVEGGEKKLLK